MSENFKLKVCVGNSIVELEGEGALVHAIFTELREHGLGLLSSSTSQPSEAYNDENTEETKRDTADQQLQSSVPDFTIPNIKDVVVKNLPKTETEWVLVYAFYVTNNGNKLFTMENVRQMYRDTNRYTEVRNKNFSTNFKNSIKTGWFNAINDNDYSLSEAGKEKAYEILKRNPTATDKTKSPKAKQSYTKTSYQMVDLGLDETERSELKTYFDSFGKLNNMEKSLVLASWLITHKKSSEVNEHIIFTALRIVGQSTSFDIAGSLKNGKNKSNFFALGETAGYYKLHYIGEDHIKELERQRGK